MHTGLQRKKFLVLAGILFFLLIVNFILLWGNIIDDAYISLRYARNLAEGHGLVYNPGVRVEGYTNFLWVILESFVIYIGLNPVFYTKILGALSGIACWFLILHWSRIWIGDYEWMALIAPAYLSLNGYFIRYALTGMETVMYGLLLTAGLFFITQQRDGKGTLYATLLFLAASLTRPEGILFAVIVFIFQGHLFVKKCIDAHQFLRNILLFVIPFTIYTVWRFIYFGSILPNTYYVRMGSSWSDYVFIWRNGLSYTWAFLGNHLWIPIVSLASILFFRDYKGLLLCVLILVTFTAVISYEGGDWMPFNRMFVPVIPIIFLLVGVFTHGLLDRIPYRSRKITGLVVVMAHVVCLTVISFSWWPVTEVPTSKEFTSAGKWYRAFKNLDTILDRDVELGQWIGHHAPPGLIMALKSAGTVPYYSRLVTYDCLGVTDPHIARTNLKKPAGSIQQNTAKKKQAVIMPAHGKEDWDYILSKTPDIILEADPDVMKRAGYKQYRFPGYTCDYWAKSPIPWR